MVIWWILNFIISTWQNFNAFTPKNGTTNIFFVTVTQDQAYRLEAMSDEEIKKEVTEVVRSMYGKHVAEPTHIYVPRWHSDPLYRGTYRCVTLIASSLCDQIISSQYLSNWPIGEMEEHHVNMKAPVGRVWFAGEAMSREYYGYLQVRIGPRPTICLSEY